jgi:glycosyltransferase involved in cell wall biosynthesis
LKVIHIELGRYLYGGGRQVAYLLDGLSAYPGQHVLVCRAGSEIAGAVRNPAVRVRALPFRGDIDLAWTGRLRRVIREEQPDLLHVHSRIGGTLTTLAGKLENIPMVHSRRIDNPPRWIDLRLRFPLFKRIVTISEGIRQVMLRAGVPASQMVCVPSAVDTERYRPGGDPGGFRQSLGLSADCVVVGVIAQMIPRKGHEVLFDALPSVLERHPGIRVLLFGKGPLEPELRRAVAARGLEGPVVFAGYRTDMPQVIPCLNLVAHPAWMEGLGVSLLETAACGVPIVAARAGGMPEIVHDGVNGRLIEPGDSRALAGHLLELLDHPERRRAFGEAGRRLALERFSVARMVAGNYGVYQELAGNGAG